MSTMLSLLVDEETQAIFSAWRIADPSTREGILIFSAIGLVTTLAVIWAIFLRKRRRHSHHHSSAPPQSPEISADASATTPSQSHRKRRRRRRRRSLNPTLAETGGLPPIRSESPPQPRP